MSYKPRPFTLTRTRNLFKKFAKYRICGPRNTQRKLAKMKLL